MFWKDELARKLLAKQEVSYEWLLNLRRDYPQLRVKTLDARGNVPGIRFDDRTEWFKPKEWAENHRQSVRRKYQEWHGRAKQLGYDLPSQSEATVAQQRKRGSEDSGDNAEITTLRRKNQSLTRNYLKAMKILKLHAAGGVEELDDTLAIAGYDVENPTLVF